jgi:hypothetical protein
MIVQTGPSDREDIIVQTDPLTSSLSRFRLLSFFSFSFRFFNWAAHSAPKHTIGCVAPLARPGEALESLLRAFAYLIASSPCVE